MDRDTPTTSPETISRLIDATEQVFGKSPRTPKDFEQLRLSVFERTGILLSPTTLKRLWGYLNEPVTPRPSTLDPLCRYAGWADMTAFLTSLPTVESGPLAIDRLDHSTLTPGFKVSIAWLPDRLITVAYRGGSTFEILKAVNTRLQPGDTFRTEIIATDLPLYADRLTRDGRDLGVYVCGRNSGIRFFLQKD